MKKPDTISTSEWNSMANWERRLIVAIDNGAKTFEPELNAINVVSAIPVKLIENYNFDRRL